MAANGARWQASALARWYRHRFNWAPRLRTSRILNWGEARLWCRLRFNWARAPPLPTSHRRVSAEAPPSCRLHPHLLEALRRRDAAAANVESGWAGLAKLVSWPRRPI